MQKKAPALDRGSLLSVVVVMMVTVVVMPAVVMMTTPFNDYDALIADANPETAATMMTVAVVVVAAIMGAVAITVVSLSRDGQRGRGKRSGGNESNSFKHGLSPSHQVEKNAVSGVRFQAIFSGYRRARTADAP